MLPEGTDVMRRLECADVCPAQDSPRSARSPHADRSGPQKELLREQLLANSKDQPTTTAGEPRAPKAKLTRNRQKNRWKLKFHHQALPPEYLDHYEQSLQKHQTKICEKPHSSTTQEKEIKSEPPAEQNFSDESFKIWAERLSTIQKERSLDVPQFSHNSPILGSMINAPTVKNLPKLETEKRRRHQQAPAIAPSKIVTYNDLPYMGEMTLNNSKPRRGRKPKKADICHLIYENYGTIVPGQPIPLPSDKLNLSMCDSFRSRMKNESPIPQTSTSKTDLQNKIISSLLERKLTQEKKKEAFKTWKTQEESSTLTKTDDGPLNLCIRDLTDLRIQIQKKFSDVYTSFPEVKKEIEETMDDSSRNTISVIQRTPSSQSSPDFTQTSGNISPTLSEPTQPSQPLDAGGKLPPGYVYWPHAGLYLHPLALQSQLMYYQKLAASRQTNSVEDDRNVPSTPNSTSDSIATEVSTPPADESKSKLVLKQMSELLDPKVIKNPKKSPDPKLKRSSPNPPSQGPTKRKRSAIFIPPMQAKTNSSTPTTEVSICKFKFTGGSKPSLQEKKMLSVDSGGNFRYYNGTGNKANRGYEYFPRNSSAQESPQISGETIKPSIDKAFTEYVPNRDPQGPSGIGHSLESDNKKKRKSRKSVQREKLEQTFKEKGFLIQTQQLQSAEGATYCKFRQLRKFTRYLFRSWKDYLPGNLEAERSQQGELLANPETEPCREDWT